MSFHGGEKGSGVHRLTDPESSEDNATLPHLDKGAFLPLFLPT